MNNRQDKKHKKLPVQKTWETRRRRYGKTGHRNKSHYRIHKSPAKEGKTGSRTKSELLFQSQERNRKGVGAEKKPHEDGAQPSNAGTKKVILHIDVEGWKEDIEAETEDEAINKAISTLDRELEGLI